MSTATVIKDKKKITILANQTKTPLAEPPLNHQSLMRLRGGKRLLFSGHP